MATDRFLKNVLITVSNFLFDTGVSFFLQTFYIYNGLENFSAG